MTTAEFIKKTYNTEGNLWDWRKCSSVRTDGHGIVYSYGAHYPLAFRVAGLDFINTVGYSNTTQRHILWAKQALDYNYIGVDLWREDAQRIASTAYDENEKLDAILSALKRMQTRLQTKMQEKKRKDTQVYANLQAQYDKVTNNIKKVVAVV